MTQLIIFFENLVWSLPLVVVLMFTHIYFSIKLKFPQRHMLKGIRLMFPQKNNEKKSMIKEKKKKLAKEKKTDGVSSFKSLMTVLAGTLGTGNIIGISAAVAIGGIGSIFWVFISGVFAISTKYAETYIVLKHRKKDKAGYFGGAMYVLEEVIGSKKLATLFSIFVVIASFGIGSMIQSNAISSSMQDIVNIDPRVVGILITIICSYAVFGNEKSVANVSSILVPIATVVYLFMCIYVLAVFNSNIIPSIISIVKAGFNIQSIAGGIVYVGIVKTISIGMSKGLFSNEAGMGSSPLFNATIQNSRSIKEESIIASTSVFIDTVLICTLTGLVIVCANFGNIASDPMYLIGNTFSTVPYGNILLCISLSVFAIATIPCWGYYGSLGIKYIFKSKKVYVYIYKTIYLVCIYIGAISTIQAVWGMSSIANALMVIPNLIMIFYLKNEIE